LLLWDKTWRSIYYNLHLFHNKSWPLKLSGSYLQRPDCYLPACHAGVVTQLVIYLPDLEALLLIVVKVST